MSSRLIIWLLLVLVPFHGFAAVGMIHCADAGSMAAHAHQAARPAAMEANAHADDRHDHPAALSSAPIAGHDLASHADVKPLTGEHHHSSHKLPCCSDSPVIFFPVAALAMQNERFTTAVDLEPCGLTSVYLEGPKRPPRLILS